MFRQVQPQQLRSQGTLELGILRKIWSSYEASRTWTRESKTTWHSCAVSIWTFFSLREGVVWVAGDGDAGSASGAPFRDCIDTILPERGGHVIQFFLYFTCSKVCTGMVDGACNIRKILDIRSHKSCKAQRMSLPSTSEIGLYFYKIVFWEAYLRQAGVNCKKILQWDPIWTWRSGGAEVSECMYVGSWTGKHSDWGTEVHFLQYLHVEVWGYWW